MLVCFTWLSHLTVRRVKLQIKDVYMTISLAGYDYIGKPSEGLIRVKKGVYPRYQCGFVNEQGEIVINPEYANVRDFSEGYAAVRFGNWASDKWGYINREGKLVVPCIYKYPYPFINGYAKVFLDGVWYIINPEGKRVLSLNDWDGSSKFSDGLIKVWKYLYQKDIMLTAKLNISGDMVWSKYSESKTFIKPVNP